MNAVAFAMQSSVGMAAEDTVHSLHPCVCECPARYLRRHPHPSCIQTVNHAGAGFAFKVQLLQKQVQRRAKGTQRQVIDSESIELMAVNRQMLLPGVVPGVLLIHLHSHQMRHHICESMVVVALHPDHFYSALRIRQFSDIAKELPVLLLEAPEIQIRED